MKIFDDKLNISIFILGFFILFSIFKYFKNIFIIGMELTSFCDFRSFLCYLYSWRVGNMKILSQ